jgi:hypothetical protein
MLGFSLDFDVEDRISDEFYIDGLLSQAFIIVTETVFYGKKNMNKIFSLNETKP